MPATGSAKAYIHTYFLLTYWLTGWLTDLLRYAHLCRVACEHLGTSPLLQALLVRVRVVGLGLGLGFGFGLGFGLGVGLLLGSALP